MATETLDWSTLLSRERFNKIQRLTEGSQNPEETRFRALELVEWVGAGLRTESEPILAQEFEGVVVEANEQFVTVAFDMDNRREQRRFPRTQLRTEQLRVNDIVELHCKLTLPVPAPALTDDEVAQWELQHADLEAAQAKTKQARSLLEDEA